MSDDAKRWADMERAYFEAEARSREAVATNRRVVQLVARPGLVDGDTTYFPLVLALCSDGTMWTLSASMNWYRLADIPQEDVAPDASEE